ncbi:MAG: hypothetical protein KBA95_12030, partial [Acidobacteria bacterium]|nr:hypothetical protein [Acidobacteriota bacterium]
MAANTWTADRRLYLDRDGKVVEADDPARATLLAPAGGALPLARAQSLGLVTGPDAPPPAEGGGPVKRAPANKAGRKPAE